MLTTIICIYFSSHCELATQTLYYHMEIFTNGVNFFLSDLVWKEFGSEYGI